MAPEDQEIYEKFTIIERKKSMIDAEFILNSLSQHFTFSSLMKDKYLLDHLIQEFKLCVVKEGEYLMQQHDNASCFFLLKEGQLSVEVDGMKQRNLNVGEGFGELSLLYSSPRSASIVALKKTLLWFIDRSTFRNVLSRIIEKSFTENKKFIEANKFFTYLTPKQK